MLQHLNYDCALFKSIKVHIYYKSTLHEGCYSVKKAHNVVSSNPALGKVYSIQHYVIKLVSDLRQVGGFLWVPLFPQPIKLTAAIYRKLGYFGRTFILAYLVPLLKVSKLNMPKNSIHKSSIYVSSKSCQ